MAYFISKNWKNRDVEYPGRRTLTNTVSGTSETYDVTRSEGTITEAGDSFDASTMNDLEGRIGSAFTLTENGKLNKPSNAPLNNQVIKYKNGSIVWANEEGGGGGGGATFSDYTDIWAYAYDWEPFSGDSELEDAGVKYKNEISLPGLVEGSSIVTIIPSAEMIANGNFFPIVGIEDDLLIIYATELIEDDFELPLISVRTINEVN